MRPLVELTEYRESQEPPLSRKAMAEELDVTRETVFRWEKGDRFPERDKLLRIAEITGKSVEDLMRAS